MEATQMSIDERMDTQIVVYPHNGILFSLKKGILTDAATWVNLEGIMLGGISVSQKENAVYEASRGVELLETT